MTERNAAVTHYALLIGVDFYPGNGSDEWNHLKGSVRDARELEKRLVRSLNTVDIQMLTSSLIKSDTSYPAEDREDLPTHSNVICNLEKITSRASAGDLVYIHFSGHGTAIEPDIKSPNSSTGDLALVLLASDDETRIQYLRGSELAFQLKNMVEKGLKVTLVLDCCASGILRDKLDPSVRYLPYDPTVDMAYPPTPGRSLSPEDQAMRPAHRDASMRLNWLVNPDGYTILVACGPTEKAKEIKVKDHDHGALSYLLIRSFAKYGRVGGKQQHIYSYLCARFKDSYPNQTPMLYGNKTIGFFDNSNYTADAARIPITRPNGGLLLEAGQAHGVCNGDHYVLCPLSGSNRDPVTVEVTRTRALTSDLKLVSTSTAPRASGLTATALTRLSLRRFPVRLELRLPYHNVWAMAFSERRSLDVQFMDRARKETSFSFYVTITTKNDYEIRDESGQQIQSLPASPYDLEKDADYVLDIVEHLARFKLVENLTNSLLPGITFRESFDVQIIDAAGKTFRPGCSQLGLFHQGCNHPECLVEVKHGDTVDLVVQNREKKGGRPLHFHLYSMGSCWEIENLLHADYEVIPPRGFRQGTNGEWKRKIAMSVPKKLRDKGQHQCDDIFKIFLTFQSTSFVSFELPELGKLAERHGRNKGSEQDPGHVPDDWVALNFRVRTRSRLV